ncbi:MAG: hypothetical protein RML35_00890 [Chloroherpetonaceae bacterium]|nr:hypothetical protein [Chloroherpetonaceae bacterium]
MNEETALGNGRTWAKPMLLRHYLELILENAGFMARFAMCAMLLAAAVLWLMPRTYIAKTTLMPPEDPNKQNTLLQAAGNLSVGILGNIAGVNMTEVLVEVLRSRVMAESLYVSQNLEVLFLSEEERRLPVTERFERVRSRLTETTRITANKQGFITIEVRYATPAFSFNPADDDSAKVRAARLANAYVEMLDKINQRLANAKSLYNAEYFLEQLQIAKQELDSAYANLEAFQKSNKAVAITEQMKLQLEALSKLKASIVAEEINLDLLLRDRQPSDLLVVESRNRLSELQRKYNEMLLGKSDQYAMGLEQMPALAREYANYYREVKISEEVYALLKQLYYKERLQGYRNTPTVVVLDEAKAPATRTSPKRLETLLLLLPLFLLAAVGWVLVQNFLQRTRTEEGYARLWQLWETKVWIFGRKQKKTLL